MIGLWCGKPDKRSGFTLLELLIAITIFAIVLSGLYSIYNTTFTTVRNTEQKLSILRRARLVFERTVSDLQGAVVAEGGFLHSVHDNQGEFTSDRLTVFTNSHLQLTKAPSSGGAVLVELYTEEDDDGRLRLLRRETPVLPGEAVIDDELAPVILCEGLTEVTFSFQDSDGEEAEEWTDNGDDFSEWTEKEEIPSLPSIIYITLRFASGSADDTRQRTADEGISVFKTAVPFIYSSARVSE